jgi:hypothetical protein
MKTVQPRLPPHSPPCTLLDIFRIYSPTFYPAHLQSNAAYSIVDFEYLHHTQKNGPPLVNIGVLNQQPGSPLPPPAKKAAQQPHTLILVAGPADNPRVRETLQQLSEVGRVGVAPMLTVGSAAAQAADVTTAVAVALAAAAAAAAAGAARDAGAGGAGEDGKGASAGQGSHAPTASQDREAAEGSSSGSGARIDTEVPPCLPASSTLVVVADAGACQMVVGSCLNLAQVNSPSLHGEIMETALEMDTARRTCVFCPSLSTLRCMWDAGTSKAFPMCHDMFLQGGASFRMDPGGVTVLTFAVGASLDQGVLFCSNCRFM